MACHILKNESKIFGWLPWKIRNFGQAEPQRDMKPYGGNFQIKKSVFQSVS